MTNPEDGRNLVKRKQIILLREALEKFRSDLSVIIDRIGELTTEMKESTRSISCEKDSRCM